MADDSSTFVLDSNKRFGDVRTIQMLADAGIFKDDDAQATLRVAERINRALNADYSKEGLSEGLTTTLKEMREHYRKAMSDTPDYNQLVDSGVVNNLLTDFTAFLTARSEQRLARLEAGELKDSDEKNPAFLNRLIEAEKKRLHELKGEEATYLSSPDYTKKLLKSAESLVKMEGYKTLRQLAIASDLVKDSSSPEHKADLISDISGAAEARKIATLSDQFDYVNTLAQKPDADNSKVRAQAVAMAVRQATQPLSETDTFEPENSSELNRLMALKKLVSAQLHTAFSQDHLTTQWPELEKRAKAVVDEYAQTAMSLSYHYMSNGAAKDDSRVKAVQKNLKAEMDRRNVTLLSEEEATIKAAKLAHTSAEDLLSSTRDKAMSGTIETLATAAGSPVARFPLQPKPQLVATELKDPHDPSVVASPAFLDALQKQRQETGSGFALSA